ncbi:12812_t:CDS:2, partial [Racocetra fulgida]
MAGPCIATEIPPEIFINICQDLPPSDLLSLAQVCKKFYGYLCSTNSKPTQEIWRNSRSQFLPYVKMPPPDNMDERHQVRRDLLSKYSIPDDILRGLTYTTGFYKWGWDQSPKNRPANLYWRDDVYRVYNEYIKLDPDERKDWLLNKRKEGRQRMEDVAQREIEHENEYWVKSSENEKKREERASTIESMIKNERNEYGLLRFKMPIVEQCMVYNKAIMSSSTHTFTNRAWIGLKNKLIPEYTKLAATHRAQRQAAEKLFSYDVAVQTPAQLYSFYEIRLHLIRSSHKISVIKDDMIEVVSEAFDNAEIAQEIPRNKPEIFFAA